MRRFGTIAASLAAAGIIAFAAFAYADGGWGYGHHMGWGGYGQHMRYDGYDHPMAYGGHMMDQAAYEGCGGPGWGPYGQNYRDQDAKDAPRRNVPRPTAPPSNED